MLNYFNSTTAPASANLALTLSPSSGETPSLIFEGAPSTNSLASFNPNPVNSLTTLITAILFGPISFNTTLTVDGPSSSAGPAAATATGAAAVTPNSSSIAFTHSFNSKTVISFKDAINSLTLIFIIISS